MDLLTLKDWSSEHVLEVVDKAIRIKKNPEKYSQMLNGKTLAMIFEKTSTRTRISFEAGMTQLGGHAIFVDWKTTQMGKAALRDEIRCIDRYADIMMARVYRQETVDEMALHAEKPVINGLSDTYHPCQILGDLMTIKEKLGRLKGLTLAYIGDGNNVCNTLIVGCRKAGMKVNVACPEGYGPLEKPDLLTEQPGKASKGADVVYTDTWISMGQETEKEERLRVFPAYQVTKQLLGKALFMHCLPAYRGYEVTDEVLDSKQSIVFDQAENRMHVQKAIMLKLLGKI